METSGKSTAEILRRVDGILKTARLGLADVLGTKPERRLAGFRNLVVFGRAVTNVLQNLRGTDHDFDHWYAPYVAEMRTDPLLKFFYNLRSQILKEGRLGEGVSTYIRRFEFPKDVERLGPPPANARGFFIGDEAGGSGWEVEVGDGTTAKYYVEIPGDMATVYVHLPQAPREHLGKEIEASTIQSLSKLYFRYMEGLVHAAKIKFGPAHLPART